MDGWMDGRSWRELMLLLLLLLLQMKEIVVGECHESCRDARTRHARDENEAGWVVFSNAFCFFVGG